MSEISTEIRYVMLFHFRKGISAVRSCRKICAVYGADAVSKRRTQEWFARFRSGNYDVKDIPRSGRPVTEQIDKIVQLVEQTPHASCQTIGKLLNISHTTVWNQLKRAGFTKKHDLWCQLQQQSSTPRKAQQRRPEKCKKGTEKKKQDNELKRKS